LTNWPPPADHRQLGHTAPPIQLRDAPFGSDPAFAHQAKERWIERPFLDLNLLSTRVAEPTADGVAMPRPPAQSFEDEGVERAAECVPVWRHEIPRRLSVWRSILRQLCSCQATRRERSEVCEYVLGHATDVLWPTIPAPTKQMAADTRTVATTLSSSSLATIAVAAMRAEGFEPAFPAS